MVFRTSSTTILSSLLLPLLFAGIKKGSHWQGDSVKQILVGTHTMSPSNHGLLYIDPLSRLSPKSILRRRLCLFDVQHILFKKICSIVLKQAPSWNSHIHISTESYTGCRSALRCSRDVRTRAHMVSYMDDGPFWQRSINEYYFLLDFLLTDQKLKAEALLV